MSALVACICDMPLKSDWVPCLVGFCTGVCYSHQSFESVLLFILPEKDGSIVMPRLIVRRHEFLRDC